MAQFNFQSATVLANGRVIRAVFQTTNLASGNFSTPDWLQGKASAKTVSISTGANLSYIGTCSYVTAVSGGNLQWIVDFEIVNSADTIIFEQSVTFSIDAGYIQDSSGNTNGPAAAQACVNKSVVDATGFMSALIPSGTGGTAKRVYVSYTYGSDSRTLAQAQSVTTPFKTLSKAYSELVNDGSESGSRISLLQGDNIIMGSTEIALRASGTAAKPFVIDTYWHAYSGINPTWQNKRSIITSSGVTNGTLNFQNGSTRGNIIISGIEFDGSNTSQGAVWGWNAIVNDLTFIDCHIRRFQYNITLQYLNAFVGNADYPTFHRCIITDAIRSDAHGQGIYAVGYSNILISQCTFDRNSFSDTNYDSTGPLGHNVYIGHDGEDSSGKNAAKPSCIWRNFIGRGGSFGFQVRIGANIFKNAFTEVDIGFNIGAWGGRAALNYIEKTTSNRWDGVFGLRWDESANGGAGGTARYDNTWGMFTAAGGGPGADLPGQVRPTLYEMNLLNRALGPNGIRGIYVDGANPSTTLSHDHIVRNNTLYHHGPIGCAAIESTKPESYSQTKNVVEIIADNGGAENTSCINMGDGGSGPSTWNFFTSDNNIYKSDDPSYVGIIGTTPRTLAQFRTSTGKDANSITTAPAYADSTADLGTYGTSIGVGGGYSGYIVNLRARTLGTWADSVNDPWAAIKYLHQKYYNTNQPAISDGTALNFYGVPSGFDPTESISASEPDPVGQPDLKFNVNTLILDDNGVVDFGDYSYNTGDQAQQILVTNYGSATGIVDSLTLTNLTKSGFALDPTGLLNPPGVLDTFPYDLLPVGEVEGFDILYTAGRNVGLSTDTPGTYLASFVITGNFGTKTLYMQYNVPEVDEPSESVPAATGVFFSVRAGGLTYNFRT